MHVATTRKPFLIFTLETLFFVERLIFILLLITGLVLLLFFLIRGLPFLDGPDQRETQNRNLVDVEDIVEDPVVFTGLTVDVEGPVIDWVTKRAFVICGNEGFLAGNGLLVIRPEQFTLPEEADDDELALGEETTVFVRGDIRIFNREELEQAWQVDFPDEELDVWNEQPVVIAETVQRR